MLKLIAADVDGTLVDDDKRTSPEFDKVLDALDEAGILFAIASGRCCRSIEQTFPNAANAVIIAENGAHVRYKGEDLLTLPLDMREAKAIISDAEKIPGASILYSTRNMQYIKNASDEVLKEILPYVPVYEIVESFDGISEPPLEISFFEENGANGNCYRFLASLNLPNTKTVISGYSWLDVINRNVDKGSALRMVMEKFGTSFNEAAAFGDNYNDVEMLNSVYYSYAMKNSPDDIKKQARFTTEKDNNEYGAIFEIKKLLKISI